VITVGKHAAPDGSAVHPLVADALARRAISGTDGQQEQAPAERTGPVGWPAPPAPGGGGLGWPGSESAGAGAPSVGEVPGAQRGWRRLFRLRSAA
jgi:hypothetical protein